MEKTGAEHLPKGEKQLEETGTTERWRNVRSTMFIHGRDTERRSEIVTQRVKVLRNVICVFKQLLSLTHKLHVVNFGHLSHSSLPPILQLCVYGIWITVRVILLIFSISNSIDN